MASLTHVCMWSDNGWKRITAEQAARLHPGGTVSAHSGLFMCELCGQYVILTDGDIRIRYFKHSAYAVSVADAIAELLSDMKELLSSCDCGSACSKCLKHYRNQYVHGMLDRFAALQLLEWGVDGIKASPIKPETQINMIMPLANILKQSGCEITADSEITATGRRIKKKIVIYPAMWVEPHATNTIFVSDAYIKYAKPYAVQKILDNI